MAILQLSNSRLSLRVDFVLSLSQEEQKEQEEEEPPPKFINLISNRNMLWILNNCPITVVGKFQSMKNLN